MSLPEENKAVDSTDIIPEAIEEESTIFSDPAAHHDVKPRKQRLFLKLIAAFLALALVVGSTVAVIKLIPEKQPVTPAPEAPKISLVNVDSANVAKIEIGNEAGEVALISEVVEEDSKSSISWYVKDIEKVFVSSTRIESTVSSACVIDAIKAVEGTEEDFGIDKPQATFTLYPKNDAFTQVTVKIGNAAPSNLGYYCKISGKDEIYLVDNSVATFTGVTAIDFATTAGIPGVIQTEENADCFTEGSLSKFDYIRLSGKQYVNPLQIEMQNDENINAYFPFKVTSPSICIANDEKVYELIDLMSTGTTSAGAYCYNPTEADLKKYGLDNPDAQITISVDGVTYTVLATKADDDYFAVVDSYGGLIHKISPDPLKFVNDPAKVSDSEKIDKTTDYYNQRIVLENLSGLSHFIAEFANGTVYDFITVFDTEDKTEGDAGTYSAYIGDKKLDITNFKALYSQFIELSPISYESKELKDIALTIRLVHSDETADTVLRFKPYSNGRYQVEVNGIPAGLITATAYDSFTANIEKTANDIKIS